MTFPLDRTVSLCVVPGGSVIVVPDPSLGGHLLQTPGQSHPALHRLGTNHNSNGHQQVFTSALKLAFSSSSSLYTLRVLGFFIHLVDL